MGNLQKVEGCRNVNISKTTQSILMKLPQCKVHIRATKMPIPDFYWVHLMGNLQKVEGCRNVNISKTIQLILMKLSQCKVRTRVTKFHIPNLI